ncbi:MAG: alpha/beta hydrolase [Halobacteriales archaeon]
MKFRHLAATATGALGAAAAANRVLAGRADPLQSPLPGDVGHMRWRGFDVTYAEAGDPGDRDLLLLHGVHAAASNKEFDRVVDRLAEDYHVIAPDLPGFGMSDRPPLVYSASLYEAFVADAARELTDDAVCIASSLTASYAVAAQRETGAFSRLVLVAPTDETGPRRTWLRSLIRSPVVGTALFNALTSKRSLGAFARQQAVEDPSAITPDDVAHLWQTAHQSGAKFAPASFVSGFLDPAIDLPDAFAAVDAPVTLVWGREASMPPLSSGRRLAESTDSRLVVVDGARLLVHHEHPDLLLESLEAELPALSRSSG